MAADISTLNPVALGVCQAFLYRFPDSVVTSARRTLAEQCQAMAQNVMQNRDWICQTYVASPASIAAQKWVDEMTDGTTANRLGAGLMAVLQGFSDEDLRHLSWHLSGDAFDIQPVTDTGQVDVLAHLVADRIAAGGQGKFLIHEAGLSRWHCQVC